MHPLSPEQRAYVQEQAPEFTHAVRQASPGGPVRVTLVTFGTDAFLLYAALQFAADEGIAVTFVPPDLEGNTNKTPAGRDAGRLRRRKE